MYNKGNTSHSIVFPPISLNCLRAIVTDDRDIQQKHDYSWQKTDLVGTIAYNTTAGSWRMNLDKSELPADAKLDPYVFFHKIQIRQTL